MTRLIVLDRDGVINRDSDDFIKSPGEWQPIPGSLDAIARLTAAGFTVAVATNQSGLGRGLFDVSALEAIHAKMRDAVSRAGGRIDRIAYCPHRPDAGCDCRKPRPGLLHQLADHYGIQLSGITVVGDSRRDLRAAAAAGARPVLVLTGNGMATQAELAADGERMDTFDDLAALAGSLLDDSQSNPQSNPQDDLS